MKLFHHLEGAHCKKYHRSLLDNVEIATRDNEEEGSNVVGDVTDDLREMSKVTYNVFCEMLLKNQRAGRLVEE